MNPWRSADGRHRSPLPERIRLIREQSFGPNVEALASYLGVPERTWKNYERGVRIPGDILLVFLEATQADPRWLLVGTGPMYRVASPGAGDDAAHLREDT